MMPRPKDLDVMASSDYKSPTVSFARYAKELEATLGDEVEKRVELEARIEKAIGLRCLTFGDLELEKILRGEDSE